ncbi:helix-turn-helix domain-containing protein [Ruania zhangjianzhongii]|uniref:helix-turn-helix domain-containing protein n=1 Tax=Ruania zhangjianzhongii TaxID=2603206 RepID=UPI0011C7EE69
MSDTTPITPYLTVPEVAEALSCSPDTVRRLIARGEMRAVRFGRLIRVATGEVARAGRPVSRLSRSWDAAIPASKDRAPSGRRPGETWQQWSTRRSAR